jgi:hypothetical protein
MRLGDKDDPPPLEVVTVRHAAIAILPGLLNWLSHYLNVAVVCYLGPLLKTQAHREKSGGNLGPLHSIGVAKAANLFIMLGYAQGGFLMARTIPLS